MLKSGAGLFLLLMAQIGLSAQTQEPGAPVEAGPNVSAPKVLSAQEPSFSQAARENRIQGTVLLSIVVDETGRPTDITVISPLGYGLDEQAEAAVEKWRFVPGKKDGKPVRVQATVEVSFRLQGISFNERTERQRTSYNGALHLLQDPQHSPKELERAIKDMRELSSQGFTAAMFVYGSLQVQGELVPKDPHAGLALIEKAADKNYAPALYAVGTRQIEGREVPKDVEKGIASLRKAATYGSAQAQRDLGDDYELGQGVKADRAQALRYFRLCATAGIAECQLHLGKLLLTDTQPTAKEQAVAWLQVAGEQGNTEAGTLAAAEIDNLSPSQIAAVKRLEARFSRK